MNIGIFGATGQVGGVMRQILIERNFPVDSIRFFASSKSAGTIIRWKDQDIEVENAHTASYDNLDIALFSCGATTSLEIAEKVAAAGAVVIDNSSAFRMDDDVPLVVPEVNAREIKNLKKNIIANPNCTTMVAMPVLKPLHDKWNLRKLIVTTFQAVSGAGIRGVEELKLQVDDLHERVDELAFSSEVERNLKPNTFPIPVAFNVIPFAGSLVDDGEFETNEEKKFRDESRKILDIQDLEVTATCTRVGVMTGHSISITGFFENQTNRNEAIKLLQSAPSVVLSDLPNPVESAGKDPSYVGRIRINSSNKNELSLFVAGDNLRKGAALNAIQIAEELLRI